MMSELIHEDTITVTLRNGETGEECTEERTGEFVNGLFIHKDRHDDHWRIATGTGILVDTVTQRGMFVQRGWRINRDQARALATRMSVIVPDEVKNGQWRGEEWYANDYRSYLSFEMIARRVQAALDLGTGDVAPMSVDEASAYLAESGNVPTETKEL